MNLFLFFLRFRAIPRSSVLPSQSLLLKTAKRVHSPLFLVYLLLLSAVPAAVTREVREFEVLEKHFRLFRRILSLASFSILPLCASSSASLLSAFACRFFRFSSSSIVSPRFARSSLSLSLSLAPPLRLPLLSSFRLRRRRLSKFLLHYGEQRHQLARPLSMVHGVPRRNAAAQPVQRGLGLPAECNSRGDAPPRRSCESPRRAVGRDRRLQPRKFKHSA
uniref:Putative transmembrane protein n=1 Tax=Toxoplasma gondii COUG TaxID=1074873 RepID=A0A2G8YAE2_TOXGO|nr:putative transmembrane protein [Toxoplasma gondii COUG]